MSEIERDHRTPRLPTLKILARRLKRPLSYFLDGAYGDRESEACLTVGLAYLHAEALTEAAAWFNSAREAAAADDDEMLQARIELALASLDQQLGHDLRAWRRAERVMGMLSHSGDRQMLARAQICLGRSKLAAGDPASAAWTFQAALDLLSDLDPSAEAALHHYLGVSHERCGECAEAAEAFHKALDIAERLGDPQEAGASHIDRAATAARDGRFDDAITYAGEAIAIYETLNHKRRLAEIHWRLGDIEARATRCAEAQRHYWAGIAAYGAVGHAGGATRALHSLVERLFSRIPVDAVHAIGEAILALFPTDDGAPGGSGEDRASTLWLRGTVCRVLGRTEDARGVLTESLRLFEGLRRPEEVKAVRRELALLALETNDLAGAREHLTVLRVVPERLPASTGP